MGGLPPFLVPPPLSQENDDGALGMDELGARRHRLDDHGGSWWWSQALRVRRSGRIAAGRLALTIRASGREVT